MKFTISHDRMVELIANMVKVLEPEFNERDVKVGTFSDGDNTYIGYFVSTKRHPVARYYVWKKELVLDLDLFNTLDNFFEEGIIYIVDWFNKEFDQDAESVNF